MGRANKVEFFIFGHSSPTTSSQKVASFYHILGVLTYFFWEIFHTIVKFENELQPFPKVFTWRSGKKQLLVLLVSKSH